MAQHGGYRAPAQPAAVSGPGSLSQRTDGGPAQGAKVLPDAQYGEAQQFAQDQAGAPMAAAPSPQAPGGLSVTRERPAFGADSLSPDEPVTNGAAVGPGAGTEALGFDQRMASSTARIQAYLPLLVNLANDPSATPEARAFVSYLLNARASG